MENKKKKCSLNKHSESEAISYCQQCKIYLCNKCHNIHPEVHDNHNLILLDNELNEIFIDICKEDAHNNKLDFFCKNHNTLCCVSCLCKFKIKGYGQHSECYTCYIDDIKDEKKNNLKENINHLEYLSKIFEQLKILFEDGDKFKEEKKLFIVDLFNCLRNKLNEYQNQLLKDIDEIYNNNYVNKDIVIESEKLHNKIKIYLEKGKILDKKWKDYNLNSLINGCIDIENNIKTINEKYETIKNNIKFPFNFNKDEINKIKINYKLYDNFDIKIKNPINSLKYHNDKIYCLTLLNDGRLASSSADYSIIIYNKTTFKPDIIIKEHKDWVLYIIQLSSGLLASCSEDRTIKLFDIQNDKYKLIQTLYYHTETINKILELENKDLVSCSSDSSIIFYVKDNLEYKKYYSFSTDSSCISIIQTKENEICYSVKNNNTIYFYDLLNKSNINSISNINKYNAKRERFIMINKELLVIPGYNKISIINVNEYKLVNIIESPGSSWIYGVCILNENMILTGDDAKIITQWKIEGNNLILLSKKETAHYSSIYDLLNLGDGHIASSSDDNTIIIW